MAEQFLNLEGRDTFNANNGYEKVKIKDGGIPQNSDLNEQSSIDEERARNIIKEGFGSGMLNPSDFTLDLSSGLLELLVREEEAGVVGTLWQDGFRLKLYSNNNIVVATNTTPVYRILKTTGAYKGRVYLVHAKQDYLDPSAKLTVRDINDINLIQVDTAVREKRVVDYYIDWGIDGADYPTRIDSNSPVLLDDSAGGIFTGKASFADSALNGFTGYLFYIGDIIQVDGGDQLVPQEGAEMFAGNSDNVLYRGGDTAHREDTEIAGLVFKSDTVTPAYGGLKATRNGAWITSHPTYSTEVIELNMPKLDIAAMQTAGDGQEQLHIPSLNAYFLLASAMTGKAPFDTILEKTGMSLDTFLATAFPTDALKTEGTLSAQPFRLYVPAATPLNLADPASYLIEYNPSNYDSKKDEFTIAVFYLVVTAIATGSPYDVYFLDFERTESGVYKNYLFDKRTYNINALDKIVPPSQDKVGHPFRHIVSYSSLSSSFTFGVGEQVVDSLERIFSVVNHNTGTKRITLDFVSGLNKFEFETGITLTSLTTPANIAIIEDVLVHPDVNPVLLTATNKDGIVGAGVDDTINAENVTSSAFDKVPKTLSGTLAKIRSVLASIVYTEGYSSAYQDHWTKLARWGLKIPQIIFNYGKYVTGLQWAAPTIALSSSVVQYAMHFAFGASSASKNEGKVRVLNITRTLCDSNNGIEPIIKVEGDSDEGSPFAPMIHLVHVGNSTAPIGTLGGILVLEGKNGLIACPQGADFRDAVNDVGVVIDGQTGTIKTNNLTVDASANVNVLFVNGITQTIGSLSTLGNVSVKGGSGLQVGNTMGFVRVACANTGTPASVLTIQNDSGASVTIKMSQLRELIAGTDTVLHSHAGISTISTPLGTIIANAKDPVDDGGVNKYSEGSAYLYCDGQEVAIDDYPLLAAMITNKFGTAAAPITTFKLPDLRGEFLRGVDDATGHDPDVADRVETSPNAKDGVGSTQADTFQDHAHSVSGQGGGTDQPYMERIDRGDDGTANAVVNNVASSNASLWAMQVTGARSGKHSPDETRPRNVYVRYYIKALEG